MIKTVKKIAKEWFLPQAIFRLRQNYSSKALMFYLSHRPVFRRNRLLRNRHVGERCFILCNGPSVKEQDIKLMRGETVLSVSNGYRHPDYPDIRPKYHFVPQITYSSLSPDKTVDWFKEMHQSIGDAELFLSWQEWRLVNENDLFSGRKTHYLCMGKQEFTNNTQIPDLAGLIPGCATVPIMALMAALYMGFNRIYLLGVDHDWFVKKEYKYFYEHGLKVNDPTMNDNGQILTTLFDELSTIRQIWGQYRTIKLLAQLNDVQIFNATHGGMLDEFERVRFEDVVQLHHS